MTWFGAMPYPWQLPCTSLRLTCEGMPFCKACDVHRIATISYRPEHAGQEPHE